MVTVSSGIKKEVKKLMRKVQITDPRQEWKVKYPLLPTLFGIFFSWINGANSAVAVADYWYNHLPYLKKVIPNFPDECISHDTIRRLLCLIEFKNLQEFLMEFCNAYAQAYGDELTAGVIKRILSLDGQAVRAMTYEPKLDRDGKPIKDARTFDRDYYVTLYDSTCKITLAQDDVKDKENENKACARLIKLFDLTGALVTVDALNTQESVCTAIIEQNGDYCFALKNNHKTLANKVKDAFDKAECGEDFSDMLVVYTSDVEIGHGRVERRIVKALPAEAVKNRYLGKFADTVKVFFKAITEVYDKKYQVEEAPIERYFISSLEPDIVENIAELGYKAIRGHWHIENNLHWCLDVLLQQDHMQMKSGNYALNKVYLNKISLNILEVLQPMMSRPSEVMSKSRILKCLSYKPELGLLAFIKFMTHQDFDISPFVRPVKTRKKK